MTTVRGGWAFSPARLLVIALVGLLAGIAVLAAPAESEAKKRKSGAKVSVMTRNVYLGADLGPALAASDLPGAIVGAGEIYRELESTNYPERVVPLSREILRGKPDLVGLQELALWRVQEPSDLGWSETGGIGEPATDVKYDFLKLLMDRIGKHYRLVGVQREFDAELPADADDDPSTGLLGADLDARLTMRDAILQRRDGRVKVVPKSLRKGHYEELFKADVAGSEITAVRGWLSARAVHRKTKTGFRFVNTHLEAFGDPKIREAQAKEMFAAGGPLRGKGRVVLVGDLNSGVAKHNIGPGGGGSGNPDDRLAYQALLGFGMLDRGVAGGDQQTCCYPDMFDETLKFTHTVDHVMTKSKRPTRLIRATATGNDPEQMTPSGLWPSDHGGLISVLRLR